MLEKLYLLVLTMPVTVPDVIHASVLITNKLPTTQSNPFSTSHREQAMFLRKKPQGRRWVSDGGR